MNKMMTPSRLQRPDCDAIVVGAGFGGLYAVHRLRDLLGLDVRAYDNAGDVGGTWYWNRYPGALSDTESYCYRFSFDKEFLNKGRWKRRYLTQPEILEYLGEFADHFDLRRSYQFNTRVTRAEFDEAAGFWKVSTDKGETITTKYLVTGLGLLSVINRPPFKGVERFKGEIYHTGAWPQGVDLTGKRVGVIGTGSTGVQVIIAVTPIVKRLTVFQRSAQYVVPIANWKEDEEIINRYKARYDEIWKQIKSSAVAFGFEESETPCMSVSEEERRQILEENWQAGGGFRFMFATFSDVATDEAANKVVCDFIKGKIAEIVKDPETARKLMPTDYYAKRPLCGTDYFEVYNRDNVVLADIKADPIAEITANGIRLEGGEEHELDVIIMATGFDGVDGNYTKLDVRGRGSVALRDEWKDGALGYLGMMEAKFPNFFMILGPNGPFTNLPPSIETQVEFISDTIKMAEDQGLRAVEPTKEARDAWMETCRSIADATLFPKAQSWIFGANIPGKKNAVLFYMGGLAKYREALDEVKQSNYATLHLDRAPVTA